MNKKKFTFVDLFSDIDVPKNINWVPKDFEKKLRSTTD